jgi:hypothetical protein
MLAPTIDPQPGGTPARWHYRAYGLCLASNIELPGLVAAGGGDGRPDIEVHLGSLPQSWESRYGAHAQPYYASPETGAGGRPWLVVNRLASAVYHFAYDDGAEYLIDEGAGAIWCRWAPALDPEDAVLYLLGPILGFVLRLRGIVCLHSGAVVADGRALCILGPSGSGKSSLTAVLARQGCPVLSDDVLPLHRGGEGLFAQSGYARLRLRPEVVAHLYGSVEAKPALSRTWDRRCLDLAAEGLAFHAGPARIGALYVLERGDEAPGWFAAEPVLGHEALSLLVANTYRNELLTRDLRREEFLLLAELVRRVPVLRLRLGSGLADLPGLGGRLLNDYRGRLRVLD